MKTITGISFIKTAEGDRVAYTVTEMDEQGNILKSNVKKSFIAVEDKFKKQIDDIFNYIKNREESL